MLTSIRGLSAATLSAGLFVTAAPALASDEVSDVEIADEVVGAEITETELILSPQAERAIAPFDETEANDAAGESGLSFSANVALATEYRFRGVNLSDGNLAIQGGFDVGHSSGVYLSLIHISEPTRPY